MPSALPLGRDAWEQKGADKAIARLLLAKAMVIYLWIMAVGYLTFGASAEGLILNNYSEKAEGFMSLLGLMK